MKKLAIVALSLAATLFGSAVEARGWSKHKVVLAGVTIDGSSYLRVIQNFDGEEKERIYKIHDTMKNSGLAIGLAAVSSNRKVQVYSNADENPADYPLITSLYLSDEIAN